MSIPLNVFKLLMAFTTPLVTHPTRCIFPPKPSGISLISPPILFNIRETFTISVFAVFMLAEMFLKKFKSNTAPSICSKDLNVFTATLNVELTFFNFSVTVSEIAGISFISDNFWEANHKSAFAEARLPLKLVKGFNQLVPSTQPISEILPNASLTEPNASETFLILSPTPSGGVFNPSYCCNAFDAVIKSDLASFNACVILLNGFIPFINSVH